MRLVFSIFLLGLSILEPGFAAPFSYFDAKKNGVSNEGPFLSYRLDENLQIGSSSFGPNTFYVRGGSLVSDYQEPGLVVRFPKWLFREGNLEIISRSGAVIYTKKIEADVNEDGTLNDLFIAIDPFVEGKLSEDSSFFRFCLMSEMDASFQRMCTGPYGVYPRKSGVKEFLNLEPMAISKKFGKILISRKEAKSSAKLLLKNNGVLEIASTLPSQWTYEISTKIEKPNVLELARKNKNLLSLFGSGPYPWGKFKAEEVRFETPLEKLIKWNDTIGDFRQFWTLNIEESQSKSFYFSMPVGGNFQMDLSFLSLPSLSIKPELETDTVFGTYIDGAKIYGTKAKGTEVTSNENSVVSETGSDEFVWKFKALKKGYFNQSDLEVNSNGSKYKLTYELFKGYPGEISARLSAAAGTSGLLMQTEGAFGYWFESIAGWNNYYFSKQRWGVSLKYLQSLSNINIGTISEKTTSITGDLKYRLSPGLWGRDESVGLILGIQRFNYSRFSGDFLGAGAFWARSMPQIFDDVFNVVPWLKYPKWVDVEYIYYFQSLTADLTPNQIGSEGKVGTWALNFHGKILWTKSFFGEAGFGIRSYDYVKVQNFSFGTFYSTVGLGYNF